MVTLLRFAQLKERNIVTSREQLANMIKRDGFPAGRYLTPNCRTWSEDEIAKWYSTRPVELAPAQREQKKASLKKAHEKTGRLPKAEGA